MDTLHMVEIRPDLGALYRFLGHQRLAEAHRDEDLGYGMHSWLAAALGHDAPKPWRFWTDRKGPIRLLGYSRLEAAALRTRLTQRATPSTLAVVPDTEQDIDSRPLPHWQEGRRLAFELRCCPVARAARSGVEKDVFLMQLQTETPSLPRTAVYGDWVEAKLEQTGAVRVRQLTINGFKLVRQMRRSTNTDGIRRSHVLVRPQVLVQGELTVLDPERFATLLAQGVGRHRAFGYGMLLLRPSRG